MILQLRKQETANKGRTETGTASCEETTEGLQRTERVRQAPRAASMKRETDSHQRSLQQTKLTNPHELREAESVSLLPRGTSAFLRHPQRTSARNISAHRWHCQMHQPQ